MLAVFSAFVLGFTLATVVALGADSNGYWVAIQSWWRLQVTHRREFQQVQDVYAFVYPRLPPGDQMFTALAGGASALALRRTQRILAVTL